YIIAAGVSLVILGLIVSYAPGLLKWFGRLPGDIRIEGEHGTVFIPLTSMILVSIVLTVIFNLFFRK
ncbi:MAG TPA: DUF2905 domain-containing protein, partial [Gammaproteobacteria bacterium]|nr:DUF2905 domain-containing protein [Gammaproteobacteria bacterium]